MCMQISNPSARVSNSLPMSIVIVAASCASGLALIFILAAVICAVRCKRRRGGLGVSRFHQYHSHSRRNGGGSITHEQKQLPVDVLLDYPPTTLPESDPETYDRCPSDSALGSKTGGNPRHNLHEALTRRGRNGECRFDADIDEITRRVAATSATRPDVVRREPSVDGVLPPEVDYGVKMAGTSHSNDRTHNGICDTLQKQPKRRQSLLPNSQMANEVK